MNTFMAMIALSAMTTMIFNPVQVQGRFGLPDNIEFVTHMYNASNCSNTSSFMNMSLQMFCYDTNIVNGYPQCCNEILTDVSLFENPSFRKCIKTNMTFTNLTAVSYDCNMTHMKHLGTAGTLSYVGLISMIILAIGILGWIMMRLSLCGRGAYAKM
jgi:hypothetical protein